MKPLTRRRALALISSGFLSSFLKALQADASGSLVPNARVSDKYLPATRTLQPDYLDSYHDEHFASRVTRITPSVDASKIDAESTWYPHARHIYSKVAAWDMSNRWLAIRTWASEDQSPQGLSRWLLLDGQTYQLKLELPSDFIEFRWLNRSAERCLMINSEALLEYSPVKGVLRRYEQFTDLLETYSDISLAGESNLSDDDRRIAMIGTRREDRIRTVLFYDLAADRLHYAMPMDIPHLDFATVSPSGRYVLVNGEFAPEELDRTEVYFWGTGKNGEQAGGESGKPANKQSVELAGKQLKQQPGKQVGKRWAPYGFPSHYDLTLDEDGDDIAVGVAKQNVGDVRAGSVVARRLKDGKVTQLLTGGYAMHTSCRNMANRRWCFVSYVGRFPDDYPPFADELVAVAVDGSGDYRRICQFQQVPGDYWTQCQACPNTDGKQVVFASNWRRTDNVVQAYVVQTGL